MSGSGGTRASTPTAKGSTVRETYAFVEHEAGVAELARVCGGLDPTAIDSVGVPLYGGILREASPSVFLTQSISLFRLSYHPGDISAVEEVAGRAILRLVDFDPMTRLFCRRQTGGLRSAVGLASGEAARVRHVRCSLEGDAFCEWQLEWHVPRG